MSSNKELLDYIQRSFTDTNSGRVQHTYAIWRVAHPRPEIMDHMLDSCDPIDLFMSVREVEGIHDDL